MTFGYHPVGVFAALLNAHRWRSSRLDWLGSRDAASISRAPSGGLMIGVAATIAIWPVGSRTIEVRTRFATSEVTIDVHIDGPGFPPDTVARLFKRDALNVRGDSNDSTLAMRKREADRRAMLAAGQ